MTMSPQSMRALLMEARAENTIQPLIGFDS
jgi:hypothetical protein